MTALTPTARDNPLSPERLSALELVVALKGGPEWETFVALLALAGYDIRPKGIVKVTE